jgi:hypothetical protein
MKVWHLHRDDFNPMGVWGRLEGGGGLAFHTIENPNTLIPDGEYKCVRDYYHRGDYPTFEIIVEGRDRLLFHAANYASELEGCIAPGKERGYTDGHVPAVWRSRVAFQEYMEANRDVDEHVLVITSEPPDEES